MVTEAARLAWDRGARVVVLPTVPFGVNTGQIEIKLDINMNPSTQFAVLRDVVEVLDHQGIAKLVVLNGHGGNDFRQMIRELSPRYEIFICEMDWYKLVDATLFEEVGNHGGEMETSLMMHLVPDLVRPLSEAGEGRERRFRIEALREKRAWAQRDWVSATSDTGIGDPRAASAEKGKRCFEDLSNQIADFLVDLSDADLDNFYESD